MIKTTEVCPYFGAEQRAEWHRERGLDDPRKADKPLLPIATAGEWGEDKVKEAGKRTHKVEWPGKLVPIPEKPTDDKHAAYRERNKAKLAQKARERRAGKK